MPSAPDDDVQALYAQAIEVEVTVLALVPEGKHSHTLDLSTRRDAATMPLTDIRLITLPSSPATTHVQLELVTAVSTPEGNFSIDWTNDGLDVDSLWEEEDLTQAAVRVWHFIDDYLADD